MVRKPNRRSITLPPASGEDPFELALAVDKLALHDDLHDVRRALARARVGAACIAAELVAVAASAWANDSPAEELPGAAKRGAQRESANRAGTAAGDLRSSAMSTRARAGMPAHELAAHRAAADMHDLPRLRAARTALELAVDELRGEWECLQRAHARVEVVRHAERLSHQAEVCRREYTDELHGALRDLYAPQPAEAKAGDQEGQGAQVVWAEAEHLRDARRRGARPRALHRLSRSSADERGRDVGASKQAVRASAAGTSQRMRWDSASVPLFITKSGLEASFRHAHGVLVWGSAGKGGDRAWAVPWEPASGSRLARARTAVGVRSDPALPRPARNISALSTSSLHTRAFRAAGGALREFGAPGPVHLARSGQHGQHGQQLARSLGAASLPALHGSTRA
ncbi:hypothetical protein KFE25_006066 [Diacronema lutheri]|uniref:Uncharacterized protein n=1 Tax=Diacronema lutheri TaxID=2081491 RepID=A0A8J6CFZ2_DIALT|nr:hypothetical protein KFE25_006066 [Diacronema lutheri]